jgi:hypothetical protein
MLPSNLIATVLQLRVQLRAGSRLTDATQRREPTAAASRRAHFVTTRMEEIIMAQKYGKKAQEKVERAMHERKAGTLRSGSSGKKVTSRKQAIAIGLSEARRAGGKVPSRSSSARRRSTTRTRAKKK